MKKAQFIHIENYSKKGSGKAVGKYKTEVKQSNVTGVLSEANRLKSYCSHVPAPLPPTLLYGCDLDEVKRLTEEYYNNNKKRSKKSFT
ncbi:hypothetical protein [Gilliamella sp. App6-5]|uniref:hypothetical protein n=1 Tax=Gilliamella sp. App6-5 TaxID=3120232 RepID=UPI0011479DDE|nr:hypothetical protein [Gilliamella apicola]